MAGIEAEIELRHGRGRYDVMGGITDVDGRDLQVCGLETGTTIVEGHVAELL